MRGSLRQVVNVVAGIFLVAVPARAAQAGASSRAVVEGGTLSIPMNDAAARAVRQRGDCSTPRTRPVPERRVGRVLTRAQTQQKA